MKEELPIKFELKENFCKYSLEINRINSIHIKIKYLYF